MKNKVVTAFVFFIFFASLKAFSANSFISFSAGDMLLNQNNEVTIFVDQNDCKGVMTAQMGQGQGGLTGVTRGCTLPSCREGKAIHAGPSTTVPVAIRS